MFGTGQPYPYLFWFAIAAATALYANARLKQSTVPLSRQLVSK
jgi:hypothetical protein